MVVGWNRGRGREGERQRKMVSGGGKRRRKMKATGGALSILVSFGQGAVSGCWVRGRWPAVKRETRTMELELRGEMWGSDMAGGGGGCCKKKWRRK